MKGKAISMRFAGRIFLSAFIFLSISHMVRAQVTPPKSVPHKMTHADTLKMRANMRRIVIMSSKRLHSQQMPDSVVYQSFAGNVKLKQGKTFFDADSAVINSVTNIVEAFGHVFINDEGKTKINSDYLRYNGAERKAFLRDHVILKDATSILHTPELSYDLGSKTGIYEKTGHLINGKTILDSKGGIYYGESHDATFTGDVRLRDPQYTIDTDTLLYNSESKIATFTVPTVIKVGKQQKVLTTDGYYNLMNKTAYFGKRPTLIDSASTLIADEVAMDDANGFGDARGRVVYKDTAQNMALVSGHLRTNRAVGALEATELPVAILEQEKGNSDSLYITGDTLFSGRLSARFDNADDGKLHLNDFYLPERKADSNGVIRPSIQVKDSIITIVKPLHNRPITTDSLAGATETNNMVAFKSLGAPTKDTSSLRSPLAQDSVSIIKYPVVRPAKSVPKNTVNIVKQKRKKDSPKKQEEDNKKNENNSDRYIEAYAHVRIFSDSMQAVGDSMFYSFKDSIFRLFKNPVVWTQSNQLFGDTIYLFTQNRKPKRLYVYENAVAINRADTFPTHNFFNQVKGRTLNVMFTNGAIDSIHAKGSTESIYYITDAMNKYTGVNQCTSDVLDMFFINKKPMRIKPISDVSGTVYPIQQSDPNDMRVRGFKILEYRRPKTKYELFQPYVIPVPPNPTGRQKGSAKID
ncbi:OstA-like protein [Rhizosphaericola mali]|uniref:Organic solvent tolerance-like N-terminal domain-containing protein n=1 Tax=Rhizosphaericola mali TaxID=2545455 RepID=A0A5P2G7N2_9BACT|nr:OstA-like protein [Rhizosphaericola mali]QES89780.1 hypothetical protein E0W69_014305 [Rhizosphaericola mali]